MVPVLERESAFRGGWGDAHDSGVNGTRAEHTMMKTVVKVL